MEREEYTCRFLGHTNLIYSLTDLADPNFSKIKIKISQKKVRFFLMSCSNNKKEALYSVYRSSKDEKSKEVVARIVCFLIRIAFLPESSVFNYCFYKFTLGNLHLLTKAIILFLLWLTDPKCFIFLPVKLKIKLVWPYIIFCEKFVEWKHGLGSWIKFNTHSIGRLFFKAIKLYIIADYFVLNLFAWRIKPEKFNNTKN